MVVLKVPSFGWMEYTEARYYGWRHTLHIAFWLICWGITTEAEDAEDYERRTRP